MHGLSWIGVWEFEPWIVCFLEQLNHGVSIRDLAQLLHKSGGAFLHGDCDPSFMMCLDNKK
jgi:hypothetical protein